MNIRNILALSSVVITELRRRKDFYVLFILTALITLLLASVNLFNDDKIARFIKEACLLLVWISSLVIAITTTARQIPSEIEQRTIFPLLAKPVSRADMVAGKFLGCWLACGLCLVVFYLFFAAVAGMRTHEWPVPVYVQAAWLHWMLLAVVVALVCWGSVVFAAPSSNATISFVVVAGILFLARHLNKVALQLPEPSQTILYVVYFAVPHLEFFDIRDLIIHDIGLVPWKMVLVATLYGAGYAGFFLTAAWLRFRKKSLN